MYGPLLVSPQLLEAISIANESVPGVNVDQGRQAGDFGQEYGRRCRGDMMIKNMRAGAS